MLLLTRKEGEGITITLPSGEEIQIILKKYKGQQTVVGIEAPADVFVLRTECYKNG